MDGGAAPGGGPQENPIRKAYDSWASVTPFTSRSAMVMIVVSWLASLFFNFGGSLSNTPYYTIERFEVYRLVTSAFCSGGFLTVIFALMSFNQMGPRLEGSLGSTGMMVLMLTLDVVTNVMFLGVCGLLIAFGEQTARFMSASGFWNILMPLIAIECMGAPEAPRRVLFFPCSIPSKYYPTILLLLFSFMSGSLRLDLLCSVVVGYAYALGKLDRLKPSRSRLDGLESGCLSNFSQRPGFIVGGAALGAAAWAPLNNPADHPSNQGFGSNNVIKRPGSKGKGVDAFAGSGQTLGGVGSGEVARSFLGGGTGGHAVDPQAARAARLAAVEARTSGTRGAVGGQTEDLEAAPLVGNMDHEIMVLQDMGFTASQAREALQFTGGSVEAAAAYLSA